jgi:2-methylcitrate dehydratase PrpD
MVTTTHSTQLDALVTFAAGLSFDDLPAVVVGRAQWVWRDTIGVILGGMAAPEVRTLAQHALDQHPGNTPLLGFEGRTQPEWAALVYGTAGTTLEYDEGHAFARGHAAVHAVSAALALADETVSGQDLLTATVVGYEIAARVGVAAQLRSAVHPFGAWGVLGVAAVRAKLAGFPAVEMRGVLDLAASYAIAPSFNSAYAGANVRNTFAGFVNHNGLLAVEMYRAGFRGTPDAIQTAFGEILGEAFDEDALVERLGERYEITRGYFKPYSACRYSHAAVDAVLALPTTVHPDAVQQITVETYATAAKLSDPRPATSLAARFSVPYIVAATVIDGNAAASSFTEDAIRREDVLGLAKKVRVIEDNHLTQLAPGTRAARVTVDLGHEIISAEVMGSKGDPDQPMSEEELQQKYNRLTAALPVHTRDSLWQKLGDMTQLASTEVLFEA